MPDQTPEEIEREIEAERAALVRSIGDLQREFAPEVLVDKAQAFLRRQGGPVTERAIRQARENPLALAVAGAGLAWMMAAPSPRPQARPLRLPAPGATRLADVPVESSSDIRATHADATTFRRAPQHRPAYDHRTYPKAHGLRDAEDPMAGFDERLARASGDITDPTMRDRVDSAVTSAKERLMSMKSKLADAVHDPKAAAQELRTYLTEGTESMSEATRERVIAARQAAWDAERRIAARARDYADSGRDFYGSQPLIGGLVAFGLGAAIGAALPRTRQEDRYIGSYRDRALEEAERIYRAETDKLRAVAETAAQDATRMASETLDDVKAEARKQNIGGSV